MLLFWLNGLSAFGGPFGLFWSNSLSAFGGPFGLFWSNSLSAFGGPFSDPNDCFDLRHSSEGWNPSIGGHLLC